MNFKIWLLAFSFPLCAFSAGLANTLPSAEDISRLAETAKQTVDIFMRESFELRMGYEYSGQFLSRDDKDNLQKIAKRASDRL